MVPSKLGREDDEGMDVDEDGVLEDDSGLLSRIRRGSRMSLWRSSSITG